MSDLIGASEQAGLEAQSGTERPLSDEERALISRLLSDPFSYPQQFKTWLVSFLEGSDLLLPRSSVQGLSSLLGSGGGQGVLGLLPAGMIFPYGGAAAPVGALLCNGAPYSRTGYKRLFDAIGSAFGAGDGSTTFNVPDLRRRLPFGSGTGFGIGGSEGRAEANRHIDHHHYFQDTKGLSIDGVGDHSHGLGAVLNNAINPVDSQLLSPSTGAGSSFITSGAGGHSHSGSVTVAGDTSGGFDNNRPAFLTVGFIINY